MRIYFEATVNTGNVKKKVTVYEIELPDYLIPLWKRASIYEILYIDDPLTGKFAYPHFVKALTDMCIFRTTYRQALKSKIVANFVSSEWHQTDEDAYLNGLGVLAQLIESCSYYPNAIIRRRL